jgi:hypothetical protein
LGIKIDDQNPVLAFHERRGKVDGGGSFSDTTFLIDDCHGSCHTVTLALSVVEQWWKGSPMAAHEFVPATPADARAWVRTLLPHNSDDAELVISELVTNAMVHGPGTAQCRAIIDGDAITVEVSQVAQGDVHLPRSTNTQAIGGRGLTIVEAVSDQWGSRFADGYFTVWATLPIH